MKSNIWILGDPHLLGETPWNAAVARKMIKWIKSHPLNIPTTEIIITGDLVDKFSSLPPTHDLVIEFLKAFRTSKIHLVVGNHDVDKMSGFDSVVTKGKGQMIAYPYVDKLFGDSPVQCKIYEYPEAVNICGLTVLMLPYYKAPSHCLDDYNSRDVFYKKYPELANIKIDLMVGHIIDSSSGLPPINCVDVFKLLYPNEPMIVLGHLHAGQVSFETRLNYTGSLYGLKIDERGPRYEIIYDAEKRVWSSNDIPVFSEMISVKYGESLPQPKLPSTIPVYTIFNCASDDKARKLYGDDVFIRKTISSWEFLQKNKELEVDADRVNFAFLSKEALIGEFEKEIQTQTGRAMVEDVPLSLKALEVIKTIQGNIKEGTV